MTHYKIACLNYVSPPSLSMPTEVKRFVESKGIVQREYDSLEDVITTTDVIYMTRIQRERFASADEYNNCCGLYVITPQLMTKAKTKMIVMHPLPRLNEIS